MMTSLCEESCGYLRSPSDAIVDRWELFLPSPLVGEGGERSEPGERDPHGVAFGFCILQNVFIAGTLVPVATPHPALSRAPSPARGEGADPCGDLYRGASL
jgi:hypothetical protein